MYKTMLRTVMIATLLLAISACKKDDDDAPSSGTPSTPAPPAPDATFTASRVVTTGGTAHNATAMVLDPTGMPVYIGDVSLNGYELDTLFAGFYHLSSNGSTLNLSIDDLTWSADNGGNGYPMFQQNANTVSFPVGGTINSNDTIDKSVPYTFSWTNVSGADSVSFNLGVWTHKILPGNATSCTFTSNQMDSLSAGSTYATISATTYQSNTIGGKRCQFRKQQTAAMVLTVVD